MGSVLIRSIIVSQGQKKVIYPEDVFGRRLLGFQLGSIKKPMTRCLPLSASSQLELRESGNLACKSTIM